MNSRSIIIIAPLLLLSHGANNQVPKQEERSNPLQELKLSTGAFRAATEELKGLDLRPKIRVVCQVRKVPVPGKARIEPLIFVRVAGQMYRVLPEAYAGYRIIDLDSIRLQLAGGRLMNIPSCSDTVTTQTGRHLTAWQVVKTFLSKPFKRKSHDKK